MIEIQIKEEKYDIPTEWKDITLEYWCGLYNIIKKYTETAEEEEKEEVVEPKLDEVKVLRMNREIFKYVTGINDAMLNQLDLESVNTAVGTIGQMMEEYKPQGLDRFEFDGDVYFPEWDFNGLGEVSVDQAYIVKVHQQTTFETCGTQISPELMPIDLESGWNFIPYLRVESAPVSSVLADLNANNNLVLVKDYLGNAYYPSESFNGIGDMQAGQGYLLYVISPAVLQFLSNDQSY